jgi:hypothetical protein
MTGSDLEADFTAFFEAEYERLFQALYLMSGNRADAEDLAQDTMARAFDRWDRVRTAATPSGYVFQIAFNREVARILRGGGGTDPGDRTFIGAGTGPRARASLRERFGGIDVRIFESIPSALPIDQRDICVSPKRPSCPPQRPCARWTSSSNSLCCVGSKAADSSGCHCTPIIQPSPSSSTASASPSSDQPVGTSPSPSRSIPW